MKRLRPTAQLHAGSDSATVESLTARISTLAAERQSLRATGASETALERNRVQIARAQWDLSHALIERYLAKPEPSAQTAA